MGVHTGEIKVDATEVDVTETDASYKKAYSAALKLLSVRSRTVVELQGRIKAKGYGPDIVGRVIDDLKERKYLDDASFCQEWLQERIRHRPVGSLKARYALLKVGISEAILSMEIERFYREHSEMKLALTVARNRMKIKRGIKPVSLARFLIGRGFTEDVVWDVVGQLTGQEVNW